MTTTNVRPRVGSSCSHPSSRTKRLASFSAGKASNEPPPGRQAVSISSERPLNLRVQADTLIVGQGDIVGLAPGEFEAESHLFGDVPDQVGEGGFVARDLAGSQVVVQGIVHAATAVRVQTGIKVIVNLCPGT